MVSFPCKVHIEHSVVSFCLIFSNFLCNKCKLDHDYHRPLIYNLTTDDVTELSQKIPEIIQIYTPRVSELDKEIQSLSNGNNGW